MFDMTSLSIQLIPSDLFPQLNSNELSSRDIYAGNPGAQSTLPFSDYQDRSERMRSKNLVKDFGNNFFEFVTYTILKNC